MRCAISEREASLLADTVSVGVWQPSAAHFRTVGRCFQPTRYDWTWGMAAVRIFGLKVACGTVRSEHADRCHAMRTLGL